MSAFDGSSYFSSALDKIKKNLDNYDPVIALLAFSPTSMHYVNVVAVSENDEIAILDTDNSLYYYSKDDFEDLMDCSSYIPHNIFLYNYNLIRFASKDSGSLFFKNIISTMEEDLKKDLEFLNSI